jgi:hypothetical protein
MAKRFASDFSISQLGAQDTSLNLTREITPVQILADGNTLRVSAPEGAWHFAANQNSRRKYNGLGDE